MLPHFAGHSLRGKSDVTLSNASKLSAIVPATVLVVSGLLSSLAVAGEKMEVETPVGQADTLETLSAAASAEEEQQQKDITHFHKNRAI